MNYFSVFFFLILLFSALNVTFSLPEKNVSTLIKCTMIGDDVRDLVCEQNARDLSDEIDRSKFHCAARDTRDFLIEVHVSRALLETARVCCIRVKFEGLHRPKTPFAMISRATVCVCVCVFLGDFRPETRRGPTEEADYPCRAMPGFTPVTLLPFFPVKEQSGLVTARHISH